MSQAIVLRQYGGPEVLIAETQAVGDPGQGQLRIRQTAIGVNFHDIYVRGGQVQALELPGVPGIEAVGRVEAIGPDVQGFSIGDRIAYVSPAYGGYAQERLLPADIALKLPEALDDDVVVAASLMKAFSTCMLLRRLGDLRPGQTILVHAAAGGMGQFLCNWAKALDLKVIGTVGSVEKGAVAKAAGADQVLYYRQEDVIARVLEITGGTGVAVAYDSVGADTFQTSLDCLDYGGSLVSFGQSSGPVAPFAPSLLAGRSLSISRPIVFHYLRTAQQRAAMAQEVFAAFETGVLRPATPLRFALSEAPQAHRVLEAGASPGGVVLIP